jgi:pyrroloquinoline quinone biosynthesis protein E
MLMVISPAKTLDFETPAVTQRFTQPQYLDHSQALIEQLRELSPAQISELMHVSDKIGGLKGAHDKKRIFAGWVLELGMPLTINAVIHRGNVENIEALVKMALNFGARRVEIAHSQYYGWALENRDMLMPTRDQVMRAADTVERLRAELQGKLVIDAVVPDYYARRPKPCVGGWGRRSLNFSSAILRCRSIWR